MFTAGPFAEDNKEQATEYITDIIDKWSEDKIVKGSRFSIIFAFCGITFIMLAAANLCLTIGTYSLHARMTGICCGCCLGCLNFAALITTAVFRFNTMGKLAAISLTPSQYDSSSENKLVFVKEDGRTYSDDAAVILGIWIAQLIACVCSCCISVVFNKPPSGEELANMHAAANAHTLEEHGNLLEHH